MVAMALLDAAPLRRRRDLMQLTMMAMAAMAVNVAESLCVEKEDRLFVRGNFSPKAAFPMAFSTILTAAKTSSGKLAVCTQIKHMPWNYGRRQIGRKQYLRMGANEELWTAVELGDINQGRGSQ